MNDVARLLAARERLAVTQRTNGQGAWAAWTRGWGEIQFASAPDRDTQMPSFLNKRAWGDSTGYLWGGKAQAHQIDRARRYLMTFERIMGVCEINHMLAPLLTGKGWKAFAAMDDGKQETTMLWKQPYWSATTLQKKHIINSCAQHQGREKNRTKSWQHAWQSSHASGQRKPIVQDVREMVAVELLWTPCQRISGGVCGNRSQWPAHRRET